MALALVEFAKFAVLVVLVLLAALLLVFCWLLFAAWILFWLALDGVVVLALPFPLLSCGIFGAFPFALLRSFWVNWAVFLAKLYPSAAAATGDAMLWAWKPNILFTISSADLAKNANKQIAKVASATFAFSPKLTAVEHNAKNAIQWNGWIKILYANSLNHVFNAWELPSPILSIEYVIVTSGAIIIKNAIVIIRFIYAIKNPNVIASSNK